MTVDERVSASPIPIATLTEAVVSFALKKRQNPFPEESI
jgi:hypothetical protein